MPTVGLEWMGQTLSPGDDGNPLVRFPVSSNLVTTVSLTEV